MHEGPCDGHNGIAAMIGRQRGRTNALRDLVLVGMPSTYARPLGNALSMLDREQPSGSEKPC